MQFSNSQEPVSLDEVKQIETELGLSFPEPVRRCYLTVNGGIPSPYVFTDDEIDTVVSELLPLHSNYRGTAIECYRQLVLEAKLVPQCFFPFAVDGGGDYFFVDCSSVDGRVFYYRSDTQYGGIVDLGLGYDAFWESLGPE